MNLNVVSSNLLIAWYLGLSLVLTIAVVGLTVALHRLNERLEALTSQLEPTLQKADQALALANEKLVTLTSATESVLAHTDAVAATVEAKTETTTRLVQKTIHAPFIGVNALVAGVLVGAKTLAANGRQQGARRPPDVLQSSLPPTPNPSPTPTQEVSQHGQQQK